MAMNPENNPIRPSLDLTLIGGAIAITIKIAQEQMEEASPQERALATPGFEAMKKELTKVALAGALEGVKVFGVDELTEAVEAVREERE